MALPARGLAAVVSLEAVAWVKNLPYDACEYGPYRVLLILAEHANSEGKRAWRSKSKIAHTLEVSERSVQRWYKALIAADLIRPGDQAFVAHIPVNRRPVVYDISMGRDPRYRQAQMPLELGETGLSTGGSGETAGVALGETAGVVSRNQIHEPLKTSTKRNPSTRAREEAERSAPPSQPVDPFDWCPNSPTRVHSESHPGNQHTCGWCGITTAQWFDSRTMTVRYKSEVTG